LGYFKACKLRLFLYCVWLIAATNSNIQSISLKGELEFHYKKLFFQIIQSTFYVMWEVGALARSYEGQSTKMVSEFIKILLGLTLWEELWAWIGMSQCLKVQNVSFSISSWCIIHFRALAKILSQMKMWVVGYHECREFVSMYWISEQCCLVAVFQRETYLSLS
jgi:hypothetical protein